MLPLDLSGSRFGAVANPRSFDINGDLIVVTGCNSTTSRELDAMHSRSIGSGRTMCSTAGNWLQ